MPARLPKDRPCCCVTNPPALDSKTGVLVLEALERIHHEIGALTVVITHNAVIAEMADRVIHLSDGAISHEEHNESPKAARELHW